jgi:hypothetical protein
MPDQWSVRPARFVPASVGRFKFLRPPNEVMGKLQQLDTTLIVQR